MKEIIGSGKYLSQESEPMMIDVNCFPMLERIVMLENSVWDEGFKKLDVKSVAPTVYNYVHALKEHPKFKPHVMQEGPWKKLQEKFNSKPLGVKAQLDIDMLE